MNGGLIGLPGAVRAGTVSTQEYELYIPVSMALVVPYSGVYRILAVGGGGSGARTQAGAAVPCTGGGAGGLSIKDQFLKAGTELVLTVGSGGGTPGTNSNGNAGGDTTVVGGGVNLFAGGGGGGTRSAGIVSGGAGGTASGGDFNSTGGRGGNITAVSTSYVATGGGAVGLFTEVGFSGGDIANTSSYSSGGGGLGSAGREGQLTFTTGGSLFDETDQSNSFIYRDYSTTAVTNTSIRIFPNAKGILNLFQNLNYAYFSGNTGVYSAANPGYGGYGLAGSAANGLQVGNGGAFCGGGGSSNSNASSGVAGAGTGGEFGGGGGGAVSNNGASGNTAGGNGKVHILFLG